MRESNYQAQLIRKLKRMFPGCLIQKLDTDYQQGIPDLLILYQNKWAVLEVKSHIDAETQPNQEYFIELLDSMSFAAFIYPENEEDVLYDLQHALKPHRTSRLPQRE